MATDFYAILPSIVIAIAAIIALVLTRVHFHAGEKRAAAGEERAKKYEQFRICREIWNEILKQNRLIHEWPLETKPDRKMLKRYMDSLRHDLDYFVFFVEKGEKYEPDILRYYRKKVSDVKTNVNMINQHTDLKDVNGWDESKEILNLIEKYYDLTDKFKEDKEKKKVYVTRKN